jgi:hypothetical protein
VEGPRTLPGWSMVWNPSLIRPGDPEARGAAELHQGRAVRAFQRLWEAKPGRDPQQRKERNRCKGTSQLKETQTFYEHILVARLAHSGDKL